MRRTWFSVTAMLFFGTALVADPPALDAEYVEALEKHRAGREEQLRSEDGWLTLAGLFWLEPGENRFGSDPENTIVLDAPEIPPWAGTLDYDGKKVRLEGAPGVTLTVGGYPMTARMLRDDTEKNTDVLELGRFRFHVIRREDRVGVRVKDPEHPRRASFEGLDYFPIDATYRIEADFTPYPEPKRISVMSVIGTSTEQVSPGLVEFSLRGERFSLEPTLDDPADTELWFIFKDQTSGKESYGFRYLSGTLKDGKVDLDFNRAYNPPCAFSPHATCPLPPKQNHLETRIESGEKIFHGH